MAGSIQISSKKGTGINMRLNSCYINNFGKLSDFEFRFEGGLNTVREDNGFGKSTLAAFIKAMLFGLEDTKKQKLDENERKKYEPWQGGAWGGSLEFTVGGSNYRIERCFSKKASDDSCTLFNCDTGKIIPSPQSEIGEFIFGIDRDGFERTVFLSEKQLGEKCDNKTIAAKLSDLSGVEGDISVLDEAVKILEDERKFLFKQGGGGKIGEIAERLSVLSAKKRALEALEIKHGSDKDKIEALRQETELLRKKLDGEKKKAESNAVRTELYIEYRRKLRECNEEADKLNSLSDNFRDGKPEKSTLYEIEATLREYKRLKALAEAEGSKKEKLPDAKELLKIEEKLAELEKSEWETKKQNEKKIDTGTVKPNKKVFIFTLSTLMLTVGIILGALVNPALFLLSAAGALLALIPFVSRNGKKSAEYEALEKAALCEHTESIRVELSALLSPYISEYESPAAAYEELKTRLLISKERETRIKNFLRLTMSEEAKLTEYKRLYPVITRKPLPEIASLFSELELSEKMYSKLRGELNSMEEKHGFSENMPAPLNDDGAKIHESEFLQKERELTVLKSSYRSDDLALEELEDITAEAERLTEEEAACRCRLSVIKKTKDFLETAKDNINAKYLGRTKEAFERYSELISGVHSEFSIDTSFTISKREGGQTKPKEAYSKGLRDLYSFAIRLALIDSLYEDEKPFIVIDDAFAYYDDGKQEEVLSLLKKLSSEMQIIYFTASSARMPK